MSKILVTGGAGFVGSNLIESLKKDNHQIVCIDDYSSGKEANHIKDVEYIKGHTKDIFSLLSGERYDVVFHLGEYSRIATSFDDIKKVWESNSLGTFSVLEYCREHNIKKIVYGASSTRFANEGVDHSPYSFTKSKSVDLIKSYSKWYGLQYSICYFYNVFGPRYDSSPVPGHESVVSVFEKQFKSKKPLTVCGTGEQKRAFTYVGDIVSGLIKSWKYNLNEEFELNNQSVYSILDIAKMFEAEIVFVPPRPGDRLDVSVESTKSRDLLGWQTTKQITDWIEEIKQM